MKKLMALIFAGMLLFVGCSNSEKKEPTATPTNSAESQPIGKDELEDFFNDPNAYKNRDIELPLKVFNIVGHNDSDGYQFQAWVDPDMQHSVLIVSKDTLDLEKDDYVIVKGVTKGEHEVKNLFDETIKVSIIVAKDVEMTDAETFGETEEEIETPDEGTPETEIPEESEIPLDEEEEKE